MKMFEDTNQTVEELFDTAVPEAATNATEESTVEQKAEPAAEPAKDTITYKVKHLGEEKELTADELVVLAQKGMDYDFVRVERDRLKSAPEIQVLDEFAKRNGVTRAELVQRLQDEQHQQQIAAQVQQGIPENVARQLYDLQRKEEERTTQEARAAQASAERRLYLDFAAEYPGVKDFPPEVRTAIEAGETPVSAYRAYENRQLKAQLAAADQKKKNAEKAVGSAVGDAPPNQSDAFMAAFSDAFKN